ncbi:NAD-dependent epimerase/dehydratase family protein [Dermabacteraceae bacterium P13115]
MTTSEKSHTRIPTLAPGTRLLVLGGAGFIGSHLPAALAAAGIKMGVYDLYPVEYPLPDGIEVVSHLGDIRDEELLTEVMADYDAVLNLAAAHHDFGISEETFHSVNVDGARIVTAAMRRNNINNLCFYSSVAVYGDSPAGMVPDEATPPRPVNTYGKTKLAAEEVYRAWQAEDAAARRLLIMRPAVVFGPRNVANVFRLIDQIARRRFYPVGPGENVKSMAYVENIVAAIIALWGKQPALEAGREIYNYADKPDLPSREILRIVYSELGLRPPKKPLPLGPIMAAAKPFDALAKLSGKDLPITSERVRKLSQARTEFSAARVHAAVEVPCTLAEGLRRMIAWYRETPTALLPEPHKPPEKPVIAGGKERGKRVVAVVVTYNREHLIGHCLDGLAAQTRPVDAVVVVDNASTDESGNIAAQHPVTSETVTLHRNVGGAGGFAAGMAHALEELAPDWIWLMDDDTVPRPDALAALLRAQEDSDTTYDVLSSRAVWTDGREHPMNTSRVRVGTPKAVVAEMARRGLRPIRTASYVSALLRADAVRAKGLPNADYFIWSDDFEHTGRLLRDSHGARVQTSIVEHRTKAFAAARQDPGERFFFDVRNKIWALLKTDSFTRTEVVLYGGRTALAWLATLARSRGKRAGAALRGLCEGIARSPRASARVLSADPEVAARIRRIERKAGRGGA